MTRTPIMKSSTSIPRLKDTYLARESDLKRNLRRTCFDDRGGSSRVTNYFITDSGCNIFGGSGWGAFKNAFLFSAGQNLAQRVFGSIGCSPMGAGMMGMGCNPISIFMGGGFC